MVSTNDLTSFCTTCDGVLKSTTCPTCGDVTNDDTAKILETISWDETPPSSARSSNLNSSEGKKNSKIPTRLNSNISNKFAPDEIRIRSGSSSKSSPRTTSDQLDETSPGARTVRDSQQKSSPKTPCTPQKSSLKSPSTPKKSSLKSPSTSQKSSPKTPQKLTSPYESENVESEEVSTSSTKRTRFMLDEEPIKPHHIAPEESSADGDLDSFFKKLELIPPNICATCSQVKQVCLITATEYCKCVLDVKAQLFDTLLTDSDDDEDGYTDQETLHFGLNNRGRRPLLFSEDSQVTSNIFETKITYKRRHFKI